MRSRVTTIAQAKDPARDLLRIREAARALRAGGLVVFPTETVYGLGANALDPEAVKAIFEAKGRPQDNPLIVHVNGVEDVLPLVTAFPETAGRLAAAFWPGPLTMILPRSEKIDSIVSAGLDTLAIRVPSHPVARAFLREAGVPVAAPSANRSGRPSPTSAQHCLFDLDGRVDWILDGGACQVGLESTVLSLLGERPRLLRPGGVTKEQLEAVVGPVDVDWAVEHRVKEGTRVSSPGMKYRHYAPKARVVLLSGSLEDFGRYCRRHLAPGMWAMVFDEDLQEARSWGIPLLSYGGGEHPEEQASRLFAALRELDDKEAQLVFVRAPERGGLGLAVYNRLLRAASFEVYDLEGGETPCGGF